MHYEPHLHVVTGGPGAGKSTLIAALRDAGHAVVEEAGRAVIREQVASGGDALPWGDRHAYAREMLVRDRAAWREAREHMGPTFFDRGLPDILGYLRLMGEPDPAELVEALDACRYAREIFVAPPWEAIFDQDAERRQDFAEACRTFDSMCAVYAAAGYALVPLPLAPVAERVAFVLDRTSVTKG